MKLIYHAERATVELGYGRGMNAWAVATKGLYFHTFTQSRSLSIGLIIAMSLSTASKENTLLKLALSVKTLFPMATITQIIDLKVFWKAFLLNVFIIKGY